MDVVPTGKAQMASGSALDRIYCQPCAGGGKKINSEAFCPVCKEFLCFTCARVHRNQKMTKSHRLQDKDSLPTSFRDDSEYESYTEICQRHAKEIIKYYCLNHETLLCSDCVVEDEKHRSCKMDKLPQVVKRFKQGVEYNSLKTGLVQTASDIDKLSHEIHAILKLVDEESQTNINELRKLRNEINQYLDKKENELLAEIDQKKRISNTLINGLKSKCTNMKSSIEKLKSELQAQHDNGNQLLIVGKRAIKELAGIQAALDVSRRSEVPRYKFHRNSAIEQSIASERELGQLEEGESMSALGQQQRQKQAKEEQRQQKTVQQYNKHMEALSQKGESTSASGQEPRQLEATQQQQEHMQGVSPKAHIMSQASFSRAKFSRQPEISVKTSFDTRDSFLTSMTLLTGDRLLLVDRVNDSLKLVNTPTNKVLSQVKLPGGPWDLCLLPGDRGAVTLLLEGKIQFVSTQGNVTLQDVVKVDGQCRGIDFCDDNLIVSFSSPGKVVLMDMKGKVKKIMDKDNSGTPLFQQPYYLTVTRGSQTTPVIYVSDCGTNTITKLSISLDVLQSFQDPTLISPYGQAGMGDTQLLVCGGRSNNIQLLDTLTGDITQLIGKEAGIEGPYNVAYCSLRKMVFVTCSQYGRPDLKNFVKVFNLV
ncbi:E3 ubiquitin-protein ligase TRIM33-like [Mya arenaria]|uniref:E3 ubiquitin-protein ligase TRIM33-like n=1 Tax=Mya arenaria TaxID=6604 RepID=UPI0022E976C3|nr:E3 ubiquitin-protein ligase TRIM33-like [Mya arenaria]